MYGIFGLLVVIQVLNNMEKYKVRVLKTDSLSEIQIKNYLKYLPLQVLRKITTQKFYEKKH